MLLSQSARRMLSAAQALMEQAYIKILNIGLSS